MFRLSSVSTLISMLALTAACTVDSSAPDDDDSGVGGAGAGGGMTTGTAGNGGTGAGAGSSGVCAQWLAERDDLSEGSWSGAVNTCQAGDIGSVGRDNALRVMNLYRSLAGLPAVAHDPVRNQKAQACALIMDANKEIDHTPKDNWTCYSADGAEAAGKGNIATAPGVAAVDLYMVDPGNDTTLGHRRWILSNSVGPVGLGSTNEYSCMWVLGGSNNAGMPWVAFPPPGDVPMELMAPLSWTNVDETGWSVQSDEIDLSAGNVTITDNGEDMPVAVSALLGGYGSQYALRIVPQGWTSQVGHTYHVAISGLATPIEYDVAIVGCD